MSSVFAKIKDKWIKYYRIGVTEKMTLSLERKVILSNQIALVFFVSFITMNFVMLFSGNVKFEPEMLYSFLAIFSLGLVPFLNYKGLFHFTAFLISILTPFFTYLFAVVSFPETISVVNYFTPRFFLLTMVIVPFIVIDKSKKILIVISEIFVIALLLSTDYVFELKGKAFDPNVVDFANYHLINIFIIFAVIIILLGLLFLTNINSKYEDRILSLVNETKQKNDELEQQKHTIEQAYKVINQKNKKITSSIEYANKIQQAFLPTTDSFDKTLPNSFVLYLPRDIVSGDFFWIHQNNDKKIIIAADCTGHGVPGAFISILGATLLNDIIVNRNITKPNEILNELRKQVIVSLNQSSEQSDSRDGMDVSVCVIDDNLNLSFSGAYNPVYIIRNKEMFELKADRQPVGIYVVHKDFTEKSFSLQKEDKIYMFSDGFHSQFGGDKPEKLSSKRFKELLLKVSENEIFEQKKMLEEFYYVWKKDNEQTDDILVIGYIV